MECEEKKSSEIEKEIEENIKEIIEECTRMIRNDKKDKEKVMPKYWKK